MGILKSPLFANAGNNDLEDCAANHLFNFYKGKPTNAARFEAINRIREALRLLGFPTKDPPGIYGDDTARAVLAYKGPPRNILGPGQTKPDAVVGRGTIMSLDKDLVARGLGGEQPGPAPTPSVTSHAAWTCHLTTFTRVSAYVLTVQSVDKLQFAHFRFDNRNITSFMAEIAGTTRENTAINAVLMMNERIELDDLNGASCDLRLQSASRHSNGKLHGSLSLTTSKRVTGSAQIPPYGSASSEGFWKMTGTLFGPLDWELPAALSAPHADHFSQVRNLGQRA